MIQIKFPKEYGYWWDIIDAILRGDKLPVDEINNVGGRKSAKSTTIQLSTALLASMTRDVGIISFRHQQQDKMELFGDYESTLDSYEMEFSTNKSKGLIKFKNGNAIRIGGANSLSNSKKATNTGLSRFGNVKYIIIFFEECFEFTEKERQSVMEAVRSINPDQKDVQYLIVNACNPWAKSSPYISYCSRIQPFNVNILKETGSQIGFYTVPIEEGRTKRVIMHYTNWRVCKEYLSEGEIRNILDTWNQDKKRAATVDWGLPGYEEGAIYTHLLNSIGKSMYQEHENLFGGGDYGWGTDSASGKTVFHFCGYTRNDALDVYDEYVQCNHEIAKDPNRVSREVCQFYANAMQEYASRTGWASPFNITIRVDNMAVGFIQILNDTAKSMRCNWMRFVRCKKFPIQDRIAIVQSLMARQKLRLSPKVVLLKQEFEMSYYEPTTMQKRAKVNDHAINAFEYAVEPYMYQMARDGELTEIAFRNRNRI